MTALLGQYTHRLSNYACHSKWAQASFLLITFLMLKEIVIDMHLVGYPPTSLQKQVGGHVRSESDHQTASEMLVYDPQHPYKCIY